MKLVQDTLCYRVAKARIPETSALTNVPCGICPVSVLLSYMTGAFVVGCGYIHVLLTPNVV